ncbi:DUF342 domain-containing protein [Shewanella sp. SR44-3]|uniref:DUF342 domain-containing protein n=1 Tax=unclassified Shewanella TaxID=196818 RepID=UPI0015FA8029|nr:FapA family protein [Shewanella sp. SR44-3]MBB1268883.1 DUF342 domain-containing protein [Shewanella sp. SR44-3]
MLEPSLASFSEDKKQVELRIIPSTHGPVSEDDIKQLLTQTDFAMLYPLQTNIEKACNEVNTLCNQDAGKNELFFIIGERRDGKAEVTVFADKMNASMKITAAWGGKEISLADVLNCLKSNKIKMGLSKPKIQALLAQLTFLPPGESCQNDIAHGKAPVHGSNASIERKVSLARERLLQPQEREDGTVDMRNLGAMIMVKPKDVLMVKKPATAGTPGYTVHGDAILQKPGQDVNMVPGDGTELDPKDPNRLIATVAGQPVETKTGMQVDDVLQIKDVDVRYGHVDFKGSILISGDVHEGMVVKSSGDITVMGFVDSASLNAAGDVIVSKGIIGRQIKANELSTKIMAKGQICAQFVQYSELKAKGDILVTKQLLHSHTTSDLVITVSDKTGRRGDLIGGQATAGHGIHAVIIGAKVGTKTELFCAMDQSKLKNELKTLDDSVKSMVTAALDIEARLNRLPPKSEWQNDAGMIEQVKMMLDQKNLIIEERFKEETQYSILQTEVEDYYDKYFIKATKQVFNNVEINIGPAFNRTQREHGPCTIKNVSHEVTFNYTGR